MHKRIQLDGFTVGVNNTFTYAPTDEPIFVVRIRKNQKYRLLKTHTKNKTWDILIYSLKIKRKEALTMKITVRKNIYVGDIVQLKSNKYIKRECRGKWYVVAQLDAECRNSFLIKGRGLGRRAYRSMISKAIRLGL